MKLWAKDIPLDQIIESYTVGADRHWDARLAPYDVLGSMAQARMLCKIGLLSVEERDALLEALRALYLQTQQSAWVIGPEFEDIHSQIEHILTQKLGDAGKKIHTGRSRNDQVLLDVRLYLRDEIETIAGLIETLFRALTAQAARYRDVLMPGYTHLQAAMVSSFGLWFGAYAESLIDDLRLWRAVYDTVNHNPLGSAAGYGASLPLDRRMTTELLGFEDLSYNVVHAQMGRGKTELQTAFALASTGHTLGKLAMDVTLYNSQNFGFLKLPDALTTGSSIMPHKKNPDVFELTRAKANRLLALPGEIGAMTGNLPSGYHRDFQLLKEVLFPGLDLAKNILTVLNYAIEKMEVVDNLLDDPKYKYLYSVENVNRLVTEGVPFREAYRRLAQDIADGTYVPQTDLRHTHEGSIHNLCLEDVQRKFDRVMGQFPFEQVRKTLKQLAEP
jgi:argininosuccinate lyase